ncbi:hypothetical protein [Alcanivorax limicola]|uniref:hypothetical protein n=1 Tax=Alcanivorax limicola TaxID=2874102 RepID=UPI001CBBD5AF|nr:hypothetical protein [Alcanivorax limicola]
MAGITVSHFEGCAAPLPLARELGETSLMFLVHPTLTEAEMALTCRVLEAVMGEAGLG